MKETRAEIRADLAPQSTPTPLPNMHLTTNPKPTATATATATNISTDQGDILLDTPNEIQPLYQQQTPETASLLIRSTPKIMLYRQNPTRLFVHRTMTDQQIIMHSTTNTKPPATNISPDQGDALLDTPNQNQPLYQQPHQKPHPYPFDAHQYHSTAS
jgi:hypothetical protein